MQSNISKYKTDLDKLIDLGDKLYHSIQYECYPEPFEKQIKPKLGAEYDKFIKDLPSFKDKYQNWYGESLVLIKQLLPDRINDFISLYEKSKNRKELSYSNYSIQDYLQSLHLKRHGQIVVGPNAAIPQFEQQLNILKLIIQRFESSLFDIRQLVQADLFDSELEAAKELLKNNFLRASGMMAGVVLEKHLKLVCQNHNIAIGKSRPMLGDFNEALKSNGVIEITQWRFIGFLADIRNLCGHDKAEPTAENIRDLIMGTEKILKTVF